MRREREAAEDVTHCVGKDGAIRLRTRTAKSTSGHSAKSRSVNGSKRSGHSRASKKANDSSHSKACKSPGSPSSKGDGHSKRITPDRNPITVAERCYELPPRVSREKCIKPPSWQNGKYVRDECGSGIVPVRMSFLHSRRKLWCKTPLSMYQATIGELGREILCREKIVPRDVRPGPPCNIEAFILPPCRGYYRKYDCMRPCEEMYAFTKGDQKIYRNEVDRYWEPCMTREKNGRLNINEFAGHNVYLGKQLRRQNENVPCW